MAHERVLCVDDDANILEAMRRTLGTSLNLTLAVGGEAGMKAIRDDGPFAVIVSDLRMPVVDGITLLKFCAEAAPTTVRILLTGNADLEHALLAVNEGNIYRFLTKPCPASQLKSALRAGIEQHQLLVSQKVLLEQTLRGSIRALSEVLSLVHPVIGAQTSRIRRLVVELGTLTQAENLWRIEITALLAHLGYVTLSAATVERLHQGAALDADELLRVESAFGVAARVLSNIPRMEEVQSALLYQKVNFDGRHSPVPGIQGERIPLAARMLRLAIDYDGLESSGHSPADAIAILSCHVGGYDPSLLAALKVARCGPAPDMSIEVVAVRALRKGMVFLEDFHHADGTLLVAKGAEVGDALLSRIESVWDETLRGRPIRVSSACEDRSAEAA